MGRHKARSRSKRTAMAPHLTCQRKARFDTQTEAYELYWREVDEYGADPDTLNVYRCRSCDGYHVGHDARKRN